MQAGMERMCVMPSWSFGILGCSRLLFDVSVSGMSFVKVSEW